MKKQKSDYSINGEIFYFLFVLHFPHYFWSTIWSGDGDALIEDKVLHITFAVRVALLSKIMSLPNKPTNQ